jgi:hypothetical protein
MPEESEEDESFEAGSDEGDSDDESVDAEDGVAGVSSCVMPCRHRPGPHDGPSL